MERSIFHQLDAPSPRRFAALQRTVRLAESLGIARVWCLPGTAPSGAWADGAPEIWLAALAGATDRIRLGWGVPGLWPPATPPVREAEQAAALDVASGGRLDLALLPAESTRSPEADESDETVVDGSATRAPADGGDGRDEGVRMLVDMWAPATFSWTSARFAVPPIDVVPKPLQRPHPPLWLVGWSAEHARAAGRAGLSLLDVSGGGLPLWQAHRACYVEARAGADPADLAGPAFFAVAVDLPEGSELAAEAHAGRAGPARRSWLAALEASGIDAVVLRAGLRDEGEADGAIGDEAARCDAARGEAAMRDVEADAVSRRIRWLAAPDRDPDGEQRRI